MNDGSGSVVEIIKNCSATLTKYPLKKKTPSVSFATHPASNCLTVATEAPAEKLVIAASVRGIASCIKISSSTSNSCCSLSVPPSSKLTITCVSWYPSIFAFTPLSEPTIFFPTNELKYWVISNPLKVLWSSKEVWFADTTKDPGITTDPSLKIWLPNCSTWFWTILCRVVSSLAWTGCPGLNNTL